MKIIIAGSRNIIDKDIVNRLIELGLSKLCKKRDGVVVIAGGAQGVDSLAAKWAVENTTSAPIIMPAEWDKYGKSAGYRRNEDMAAIANALIAIRRGGTNSRGTTHMINIMKKLGKPYVVFEVENEY